MIIIKELIIKIRIIPDKGIKNIRISNIKEITKILFQLL